MVDLRPETASSSEKTEFTVTEDQSRTHQIHDVYGLINAASLRSEPLSRLLLFPHVLSDGALLPWVGRSQLASIV